MLTAEDGELPKGAKGGREEGDQNEDRRVEVVVDEVVAEEELPFHLLRTSRAAKVVLHWVDAAVRGGDLLRRIGSS